MTTIAVKPESQTVPAYIPDEPPMVTAGGVMLAVILMIFGSLHFKWADGNYSACSYRMGNFHGMKIQEGEWQRLLLPTWLHNSFEHFVYTGALAYLLIGTTRNVATISWSLLICVIGSTMAFVAELIIVPERVSLGISSGVYSLIGASLVAGLVPGVREPDGDKSGAVAMACLIFVCQAPVVFNPKASHIGHVTGLLTGAILGWALCIPFLNRWMRISGTYLMIAYLCTLGFAAKTLWDETQPWAIAQPQPTELLEWQLDRIAVTLDIPSTQFNSCEYWEIAPGTWRLYCGDHHSDPVVFDMTVSDATEDRMLEVPPEEPERATRVSPPIEVTIDGHRFWFLDCRNAKSEELALPRWVGIVNGHKIDLEVSMSAEANESWRSYARDIHKNLRFFETAATLAAENEMPQSPLHPIDSSAIN